MIHRARLRHRSSHITSSLSLPAIFVLALFIAFQPQSTNLRSAAKSSDVKRGSSRGLSTYGFLRGGSAAPKLQPLFGNSGSSGAKKANETERKEKLRQEIDNVNWGIEGRNRLPDVSKTTGEEMEESVWGAQVHIFRMSNTSEWKQRAVGPCKLLKHKVNQKIRLVARDDKIYKVRANHFVLPGTVLVPHKSCPGAYVYSTPDYSENLQKGKMEVFCFKFDTEEIGKEFYGNFTAAAKHNEKVFNGELTGGKSLKDGAEIEDDAQDQQVDDDVEEDDDVDADEEDFDEDEIEIEEHEYEDFDEDEDDDAVDLDDVDEGMESGAYIPPGTLRDIASKYKAEKAQAEGNALDKVSEKLGDVTLGGDDENKQEDGN
mmetsp:Transcript_22029/g.32833  ORF Transcript_22029/g.32833 Transcript_22029/m.32833 type:complete len:373 (+) Transcript_22029:67-1185(+)|eukprot:CAMPEP_0167749916 /NCGR_PEP_ID=MMETSP0110_2-20121227/5690_1 /TAXON_ID=629695 /ORGANISM="Gymnochlora sp., Strain CCMP2014" /LENGTH=372 /DNA_ID=CAMNT_0007635157 /DNA_START=50 /DNA_END=1168 /DNA_ORIENTATION=-